MVKGSQSGRECGVGMLYFFFWNIVSYSTNLVNSIGNHSDSNKILKEKEGVGEIVQRLGHVCCIWLPRFNP